MKNQLFLFTFIAVALGLTMVPVGCLGSDPNKNSMLFEGGGAAGTTAGAGGNGGSNSITTPIPTTAKALATFDVAADAGVAGFMLDDYADTAQTNLNAAASTMKPMLSFDGAEGSPDPGSLKIAAPYSGASQYVDVQTTFGTTNLQDWTGKKLHVRIKVDEGGTFGGGVQLYIKTGTAYVFGGSFTNLLKGSGWQEFTVNVDTPMTKIAGYDPTKVVSYGLQLNSGSAGANAKAVNFHIDTFWLE
jgi:hypothetical protein